MQSTNQHYNAFQTSIGLFLHACSALEEVTEFLAHTGLSISSSAVNDAVTNLSKESAQTRRKTGQTLCTAYTVGYRILSQPAYVTHVTTEEMY